MPGTERHHPPAGARKSKRARKGRVPMTVSSHDTVHDLRLKIVQTFTMHPRNVQIHKLKEGQWQKLEEDKMTLAGGLLSERLYMCSVLSKTGCRETASRHPLQLCSHFATVPEQGLPS